MLVAALGEAAAAEGLSSIEDLSPDKRDRVVACIVGREEEQKGLINAAVEVVAFAHMVAPAEESFPAATLRMGRERHCTELLLGIRWMVNALKASAAHGVAGEFPSEEGALSPVNPTSPWKISISSFAKS